MPDRRTSKRRSATTRTRVTGGPVLSVNGYSGADGSNLAKAAQDIADGIKARSAEFSVKIPPSVHVGQGTATHASVYANAPNADPIENGKRHPLFGNRDHWYAMHQIRFMEEGAAMALDKAAHDWGFPTVDDWLREVKW